MTHAPAPRRDSRFARLAPSRDVYVRVAAALAIVGGVMAGSAAGCGSNDGIVGGDCAPGYTQCNLSCDDLETDPNNCGACGNMCPAGVACVGGKCQDETTFNDGSIMELPDGEFELPDGEVEYCDVSNPDHPVCRPRPIPDAKSSEDGNPSDGTIDDGNGNGGDGSGGDGSSGDGSGKDGSGGDGSSADACTPPYDTVASCGSCGNACEDGGVCEADDGGFQCAPLCTAPLVDCSGQCVNTTRDPRNCGQCGKVCPSQYCFQSTCQGSVAGNIMVIGHDFVGTQPGDEEALLLTNSVFYSPGSVSLLSFEEFASVGAGSAVSNGRAILTAFAKSQSVTLDIQSITDDTSFTNDTLLTSANAVIVWDQPNAPTGKLGSLGTAWATHFATFLQGGGIIIALDADQGIGEMPALTTNAGLLAVTSHTPLALPAQADVPLAGVAISRGMTTVYAVEQNTAWFTTSEPSGTKTLYVANVQNQPTQLLAVQKVIN
jgi:hypothetical protein